MSSNAAARTRPRARHPKAAKTQSYSHPRFLKLCDGLARLDEAKKKGDDSIQSTADSVQNNMRDNRSEHSSTATSAGLVNVECSTTNYSSDQPANHVTMSCNSGTVNRQLGHPSHDLRTSRCQPSRSYDYHFRPSITCTDNLHGYQQQSSYHCTANPSENRQQYNLQGPNQANNISQYHHHHRQNHHHQSNLVLLDCCPATKCVPSASQATLTCSSRGANSKPAMPQPVTSVSITSDTSLDLRQDENCSKRKRQLSEASTHGSKRINSSQSASITSSCDANTKRHKSSAEPSRSLSPSFTKCPICLLDCMDRDPSFTNTCFHLFCFACIENWSKSKATCPLCRTKFTKIIYNIRSAGCYDEKVASPIRRDDDDDRIIYEQLQSITANTMASSHPPVSRGGAQPDETPSRLSLENLRNSDVLMAPFAFVSSSIDYQPLESLHPFNTTPNSSSSSINAVPHTSPFSNYNPYITLIPTANHQPVTSTAISSAYADSTGNTNLTNGSNETIINNNNSSSNNNNNINRLPRLPRSSRFVYQRRYELAPPIENPNTRSLRSSEQATIPGANTTFERGNQLLHAGAPQHARNLSAFGPSTSVTMQPRSSGSVLELGTNLNINEIAPDARQSSQRGTFGSYTSLPYSISPMYPQQGLTNQILDRHLFNSIYGASPDPM